MIHYILWALETLFLCLVAGLAVVALCVTAGGVRDAIYRRREIDRLIEELTYQGRLLIAMERARHNWKGKYGHF